MSLKKLLIALILCAFAVITVDAQERHTRIDVEFRVNTATIDSAYSNNAKQLQKIADFIQKEMNPKGVAVVIEAEHLCMTMRGARAAGAMTQTSALRGIAKKDARTRAEIMALLKG